MAAWVSPASKALATVAGRVAHSMFSSNSATVPSVCVSCYAQHFLTGVSLHIPEPVIRGAVSGLEFSLGVKPGDVAWSPSWFLLWQCINLAMPEAFLDRVQYLLANMCIHLLITHHLSWQPSQLIHIVIDFCNLLSCGFRADEFHGS